MLHYNFFETAFLFDNVLLVLFTQPKHCTAIFITGQHIWIYLKYFEVVKKVSETVVVHFQNSMQGIWGPNVAEKRMVFRIHCSFSGPSQVIRVLVAACQVAACPLPGHMPASALPTPWIGKGEMKQRRKCEKWLARRCSFSSPGMGKQTWIPIANLLQLSSSPYLLFCSPYFSSPESGGNRGQHIIR